MNNCKICNSTDTYNFKAKEMMYGTGEIFDYLQCYNCGCVQAVNPPANISEYYNNKTYYSFNNSVDLEEVFSHKLKNIAKKVRDTYFTFIKGKLTRQQQPKSTLEALGLIKGINFSNKILDLGTGQGELVYRLNNIGFRQVSGSDPFIEKEIHSKHGFTIYKKNIFDIEDKFDIIVSSHSFEHMSDQESVIKSIAAHLNTNGVLLLRIPLIGYAWYKYKDKWIQLDPPRHLFLHTINSLKFLLDKTDLSIEKVVYDSNEVMIHGSEQYIKGVPLFSEDSFLFKKYNNPDSKIIKKFTKLLNKFEFSDQATFVIRKK